MKRVASHVVEEAEKNRNGGVGGKIEERSGGSWNLKREGVATRCRSR